MPYALPLYRHRMTFALGADGEVAEFQIHTRYTGTEGEPFITDHLNAHVASHWGTGFNAVATKFAPSVVLKTCTTYSLDAAGHALTKAVTPFDGTAAPTWAGLAAGSSLPWECAVCVTLDGNTAAYDAHANRKRGRIFLPPPASLVLDGSGSGLMSNGQVDALQGAVQNWLEAVNDIPSGLANQCRVVVASKIGTLNSDVVSIKSDNRVDAQRRRENRQTISYVKSGVLTP